MKPLISRNGVANRFGLPALSFQWGMGDSLYLLEDGQLLIDSMDDPDALPVSIATNEEYWAAQAACSGQAKAAAKWA